MTMMMTRRAFVRASALGLAAGCAPTVTGPAPPPVTGDPDHPLSGITRFDGSPVSPPELFGHVTVVDFWASWCGPCRQGFRYLDQLFRTYVGDGLQVLAISVDDDPVAGRQFAARLRPKFPIAWDPSGQVRERFSVRGLPTTLLLNAEAKVAHRTEGFDPMRHRSLETLVRRLVRGA